MDCFYYTDSFIRDTKTLSKMCLLFDKVSTFYLSPDYYLHPLNERWEKDKEDPFFAKSPVEKDLISTRYSRDFNEFLIKNKELIDNNVLKPIIINQKPPDWISFKENEKKGNNSAV